MIPKSQKRFFCGVSVTLVVVSSASMYMRKLLEEKIFNMKICQSSKDLLHQDESSLKMLGPPVKCERPNLRNTFNKITNTDASIAIPVSGSQSTGNLLIKATKDEREIEWTLKKLTLKLPKQEEVIIKS